jgi:hypothetical protein
MKAVCVRVVLAAIAAAGGTVQVSAWADDGRPSALTAWEYRVVAKDQLLELGKKDLAAGLNQLGERGWELVGVDGAYVFKRPKDLIHRHAAEVRRRIALIESNVETWKERVAWAERMGRRGYMTERQVGAERMQLREAENSLEAARDELKSLPADPPGPPQKLPMPRN